MKAVRVSLCLRHAGSVCRKDSLYMDVSRRLICLDQMHPCVCERQTVRESVCVCLRVAVALCVFVHHMWDLSLFSPSGGKEPSH